MGFAPMAGNAVLNIRVAPRRMLSEKEAAEYVGIPRRYFRTDCTVLPIELPRGVKGWDMRDLDDWVDSLKAGAPDSDEDILSRL